MQVTRCPLYTFCEWNSDQTKIVQVDGPYIAWNSETYISITQQEPRTCKKIGYKFYC